MLLQDKHAVIYGAGGSLGGAVAKAFADAGAVVYLTGRSYAPLDALAQTIRQAGGQAHAAVVDAFDEAAIAQHLDNIPQVDISFNAVGVDVKQGIPLVELSMEDYVTPVTQTLQTRFLTAKAAGTRMRVQGHGVILTLTATPGGIGYPYTGGFSAACTAVECLCTNLAAELGPYGVRVVNIRSGGSPDSKVFADAIATRPTVMKDVLDKMQADTMLKTQPLMQDIANAAVFLASGMAAKITGITLDVTCGTTAALNYRASKS